MWPRCRRTLRPWRATPASIPSVTYLRWCGLRLKARRARIPVPTVGAPDLLSLHAELFQKYNGWIAIGHHAELFLFGADIVAQIEIDMAFEVGHLVAERG